MENIIWEFVKTISSGEALPSPTQGFGICFGSGIRGIKKYRLGIRELIPLRKYF
jgi:hypothetical protein